MLSRDGARPMRLPTPVSGLLAAALVALAGLLAPAITHAQKFPQPAVIQTGNHPAAIYTADVNGDGHADLIYIDEGAAPNQPSTTHVLLGDGHGSFTPTASLSTVGRSLAIGDLTGSGHLDIGWLTFTPTQQSAGVSNVLVHTVIAPGDGTGHFATPQISPTFFTLGGTNPPVFDNLVAAPLPDGGAASIAATDLAGNAVYVFRTLFGGNVSASYSEPLPDGVGPLTVTDLNADGHRDLVVNALSSGTALTFLGDGIGIGLSSMPAARFTARTPIHSLLVQDVNADGRPDLIGEGANGRIDVFLGNGDGTFQTTSSGGTGALNGLSGTGGHLIALADLNHDGKLDALTATPAGISTLLGQGTALLGLKGIYNAGPGRTAFAAADFNGDGNLDLAVDSPEGIAILYGNADGSFQTSQAFAAGKPALSLVSKVFIDKWPDVVVSTGSQQGQFLRGDGTGNFIAAPEPTNPTPADPKAWSFVGAGDFDGDGKVDILFSSTSLPASTAGPGMLILLGRADGTFEPEPQLASLYPPAPLYGPVATADLDGDGTFDPINGGSSKLIETHYDRKEFGYVSAADVSASSPNVAIQTAVGYFKIGRNLRADLVVAREPASAGGMPTLTAYFNNLNGQVDQNGGSFGLKSPLNLPLPADLAGLIPASVQIADVDGDGFGDIVALFHNPASMLDKPPDYSPPNRLVIFWSNGDNTFQPPLELTTSRNFYLVRAGDMDRDGKPDLVLADNSIVAILYGLGNRSFGNERHLLAGQGINDLALSDVNVDGALDIIVANGGATLSSVAALGYKPGTSSLALTPNPDVNTGGITVILNPAKPYLTNAAGTLTALPEPQPFEAAVNLTLALTGPAGVPTGSVTFAVDGKAAGTAILANGSASIPGPPQLLPGKHSLTAAYAGDATYAAANFTGTHTVLLAPTSTTLTPTTPLSVFYGQAIDGTFAITQVDATNFPLTGTITLFDNTIAVPICTNLPYVPPTAGGGGTSCPYGNPVLLDTGPHSFQVSYNGDPVNAASTSGPVNYVVTQDTTTTGIKASAAQVTQGQSITFSSVVVGNAASPTGPVNYLDGSTVFASRALTAAPADNSTNSLASSALAVGTHTITACYPATLNFGASCSGPITITVNAAVVPVASSVNLKSSLNPSVFGNAVTFSAQVISSSQGAIPTGTVSFMDGNATLGTVTLSATALASYTTSALTVGVHVITATYNGDVSTLSSSAVISQAVVAPAGAPGFTLTVSPAPVTIGVGRTAVLLVTVKNLNGFTQPVALSCSGLPGESACIFIQKAIPAGGGSTTLDVSTSAPHDCGDPAHPYFLGSLRGSGGVLAASLLGGLGLLCLPLRKRRGMKLLLAVVALSGLATLSGCGHCTDLGTFPGTYTFTVSGTAQGGPVSQTVSQQLQMTLTLP